MANVWPPSEQTMLDMFLFVDILIFGGIMKRTLTSNNISMNISANIAGYEIAGRTRWEWGSPSVFMFVNTKLIDTVFVGRIEPKFIAGGLVCTSRTRCFIYNIYTIAFTPQKTRRPANPKFGFVCVPL